MGRCRHATRHAHSRPGVGVGVDRRKKGKEKKRALADDTTGGGKLQYIEFYQVGSRQFGNSTSLAFCAKCKMLSAMCRDHSSFLSQFGMAQEQPRQTAHVSQGFRRQIPRSVLLVGPHSLKPQTQSYCTYEGCNRWRRQTCRTTAHARRDRRTALSFGDVVGPGLAARVRTRK